MDNLDEFNYINELFDTYGGLLSESQQQMLEQYYVFNLSLGEIAEELNISRAAVQDALKKGIQKCKKFEEELHLLEKKNKINNILNEEKISSNEKLESIRKVINDGIWIFKW